MVGLLDTRKRLLVGGGNSGRWMGWMTIAAMGWWGAGVLGAQGLSEVERLRSELEQARQEIQALRKENARLRGEGTDSSAAALVTAGGVVPGLAPTGVTPTVASSGLILPAPVAEGSTITIDQLLADYGASAMAAEARYRGRRIRLEGTAQGFRKVFVGMTWGVLLQADNRLGQVRASVHFPGISDFRSSADEKRLEGRRPFKAWQTLVEVGQPIVVEGVVEGLDGSVVVVKDGKVMTDRR